MKTAPVEITIVIDSDGNYAVGVDSDDAREKYTDTIGTELNAIEGFRMLHLHLTVPLPEPITLTGTVGEVGGEVRLTVASEVA